MAAHWGHPPPPPPPAFPHPPPCFHPAAQRAAGGDSAGGRAGSPLPGLLLGPHARTDLRPVSPTKPGAQNEYGITSPLPFTPVSGVPHRAVDSAGDVAGSAAAGGASFAVGPHPLARGPGGRPGGVAGGDEAHQLSMMYGETLVSRGRVPSPAPSCPGVDGGGWRARGQHAAAWRTELSHIAASSPLPTCSAVTASRGRPASVDVPGAWAGGGRGWLGFVVVYLLCIAGAGHWHITHHTVCVMYFMRLCIVPVPRVAPSSLHSAAQHSTTLPYPHLACPLSYHLAASAPLHQRTCGHQSPPSPLPSHAHVMSTKPRPATALGVTPTACRSPSVSAPLPGLLSLGARQGGSRGCSSPAAAARPRSPGPDVHMNNRCHSPDGGRRLHAVATFGDEMFGCEGGWNGCGQFQTAGVREGQRLFANRHLHCVELPEGFVIDEF